jgi:hypothetical protein
MTASIAQCSQRRHSLVGVSRQSHRPDSEHATVSKPAEQRPGSGRWSRPQSEQLAPGDTAFWGWSWEAGFSSVSASPGVWSPLAGCVASRLPDRPRNVHLDCALRPSSPHVWEAGRGLANVPPRADGMRSERHGEPGSGSSPHLVQSTIAPRARLPHSVDP